jgi:hypothetical protein
MLNAQSLHQAAWLDLSDGSRSRVPWRLLKGTDIPKVHDPVLGACGQATTARMPADGRNAALVCLHHTKACATLQLPCSHAAVLAARECMSPCPRELDAQHAIRVAF